jgi:hypothetical protein
MKVSKKSLWGMRYGLIGMCLTAFIVTQAQMVQAQVQNATGGAVLGPPAEGTTVLISDALAIVNTNYADSDPYVTIAGAILRTSSMTAAFAFNVPGNAYFSGPISSVSSATRARWQENGIDPGDIQLLCRGSAGGWSAQGVQAWVLADVGGDGVPMYSLEVSTNLTGICAVFFTTSM